MNDETKPSREPVAVGSDSNDGLGIAESLSAKYLADALVKWSGERVNAWDARSMALRYLSGEKSNCLAWDVFDSVVKADA